MTKNFEYAQQESNRSEIRSRNPATNATGELPKSLASHMRTRDDEEERHNETWLACSVHLLGCSLR